MQLDLVRDVFTEKSTTGKLAIDGVFFCYTLELPIKDGLPGSAIPEGLYPVTAQMSPRFGRSMPHVQDIPNRSEILIHWGNFPVDTDGCILLGQQRGLDALLHSRPAFDEFWVQFMGGLAKGNVLIHVQSVQGNHDDVQTAVTGGDI